MKCKVQNQLSLWVETYGNASGEPVILIHGLGADHRMWTPQVHSFPEAGYFLIVPDLRGHGLSELSGQFRITDCAVDICSLMDQLALARAHLVGVSMGGMVVQRFTMLYPHRVITQVIADSGSGISHPLERFNAGLAALILKMLPPDLQASMIRNAYKKLGNEAVGQYFQELFLKIDSRRLQSFRKEVNRFNILKELHKMKVPTLVLVGDAFGKLAIRMAKRTAESIPEAQFQILKGGGDPSNLLVPDSFDRALMTFFKSNQEV